jgi:hypothetical protein
MTRIALALSVGASLTFMLATAPAALAGKSGPSLGNSKPMGITEPAGSRRDRRGQDPIVAPSPPPDVKPIRGVQIRCNEYRCGPYTPFQEDPNRRAQVRDHRN